MPRWAAVLADTHLFPAALLRAARGTVVLGHAKSADATAAAVLTSKLPRYRTVFRLGAPQMPCVQLEARRLSRLTYRQVMGRTPQSEDRPSMIKYLGTLHMGFLVEWQGCRCCFPNTTDTLTNAISPTRQIR